MTWLIAVKRFDEADLDIAITRFDELSRPTPRLENAASQVVERFWAHFAARDWNAMRRDADRQLFIAESSSGAERRSPTRSETSSEIKDSVRPPTSVSNMTSDVIATRGERLVLIRVAFSRSDERPEAFYVDAPLSRRDRRRYRIAASIMFDLDDFDAALAELDARYLAGEAAAYAHTWSVIAGGYAALNRRELPATTPDFANIDHRRGARSRPVT